MSADKPALSIMTTPELKCALHWVDRELLVAKRVMRESIARGDGRSNFAAHDAHENLSSIRLLLLRAQKAEQEAALHAAQATAWEIQASKHSGLRAAAQAVVNRWDTPLWKDVVPTAAVINQLRRELAAGGGAQRAGDEG